MSDPSDTGMTGRQTPSGSADQPRMGEDLRAAARETRMAASEAASSVKQEGAALLDTAKERVGELAEDTRQAGAERTQGLARAIHRAAEELERDSPQIARLVRDAAGSVDEVARTIRERSPRDMLRGVEDFARRQPLVFMGAAALAGFAVARFARSSAAERRHAMGGRSMHAGMYGQARLRETPHGMGAGSGAAMGGLSGTSGTGSATHPHGAASPQGNAPGAPGWVANEDGKAKPATAGSASLGGAAALKPRGGSENG